MSVFADHIDLGEFVLDDFEINVYVNFSVIISRKKNSSVSLFHRVSHWHCTHLIPSCQAPNALFFSQDFIPSFFPNTRQWESLLSVAEPSGTPGEPFQNIHLHRGAKELHKKKFITHLLLEWKPNNVSAFLAAGTGKPWISMASTAMLCGPSWSHWCLRVEL